MIECTPLINENRRREIILDLLEIKPTTLLEGDLVEAECLDSFQLLAKDTHGLFGTALLSKRSQKDFPGILGIEGSFLEHDYFYELSLVYGDVPPPFEADLQDNPQLMGAYCKRFYTELFAFLKGFIDHRALIVRTTLDEYELMSRFGLWQFSESKQDQGHCIGILQLSNSREGVRSPSLKELPLNGMCH